MFLKDEISKCELTLLPKAGIREQLFYWYLTNSKNIDVARIPDNDLDKICYSAFYDSRTDVSKEIERNINATPVKGLHFSSNLILQIAFALKSVNAKNEYLDPFFKRQTLIDQFVISSVFKEFELTAKMDSSNSIEVLIYSVFNNPNYDEAQQHLLKAFEKVDDLKELYVVRKVYEKLITLHPANLIVHKYEELSSEISKLIRTVSKRIDFLVNFFFILIATGLMFYIPYIIITKWVDWDLEPFITGISIAIPISWAIIYAIHKFKPSWFNVISRIKIWILRMWFLYRKTEYNKIKDNLQ